MLLESTRPLLLFVVVVATAAFIGTIPVDAQDAASASPLACCAPKPGSDIVVTARKENRKGQHYNVLIAETTCMNELSFNCVLPPNETVCKPRPRKSDGRFVVVGENRIRIHYGECSYEVVCSEGCPSEIEGTYQTAPAPTTPTPVVTETETASSPVLTETTSPPPTKPPCKFKMPDGKRVRIPDGDYAVRQKPSRKCQHCYCNDGKVSCNTVLCGCTRYGGVTDSCCPPCVTPFPTTPPVITVTPTTPDPCSNVSCKDYQDCDVYKGEAYCKDTCRDNGPCSKTMETMETCVLTTVNCVRAPCPKVAKCSSKGNEGDMCLVDYLDDRLGMYKDGERWVKDACTQCKCNRGEVVCSKITCDVDENCEEYSKPRRGSCCGRCLKYRDECSDSLTDPATSRRSGDRWKTGPCTTCMCVSGEVVCATIACSPEEGCLEYTTPAPDECCPKCARYESEVCRVRVDGKVVMIEEGKSYKGQCETYRCRKNKDDSGVVVKVKRNEKCPKIRKKRCEGTVEVPKGKCCAECVPFPTTPVPTEPPPEGCIDEETNKTYDHGELWRRSTCVDCSCNDSVVECRYVQNVDCPQVPGCVRYADRVGNECCRKCVEFDSPTATPIPGLPCLTTSGRKASGEYWQPNNDICYSCMCDDGSTSCIRLQCQPIPDCGNYGDVPEGECCPICNDYLGRSGNIIDACILPKEEGACIGRFDRFYFDMEDFTCKPFFYSGCAGNTNNFASQAKCNAQCDHYIRKDQSCAEEPDYGSCTEDYDRSNGSFRRFYYDSESMTCERFLYSSCGGNANNFKERRDCLDYCLPPARKNESNDYVCRQQKTPGPCKGNFPRYYYGRRVNECREFTYGGCGGNENNFLTLEDCQGFCMGVNISASEFPPTPTPASGGNVVKLPTEMTELPPDLLCTFPKDVGPCKSIVPRYYFNFDVKRCERFNYGGCKGNANRFTSLAECQSTCPKLLYPMEACMLPVAKGPCKAGFKRYYYNSTLKQCQKFAYGGCLGNANNFLDLPSCLRHCAGGLTPCFQRQEEDLLNCNEENCFVTRCTETGDFELKQCNSLGFCWCLEIDGRVERNSRTPPHQAELLRCGLDATKLTDCLKKQQKQLRKCDDADPKCTVSLSRCNPDGTHAPQQCNDAKNKCYCVYPNGTRVPDTNHKKGSNPNPCIKRREPEPDKPMTPAPTPTQPEATTPVFQATTSMPTTELLATTEPVTPTTVKPTTEAPTTEPVCNGELCRYGTCVRGKCECVRRCSKVRQRVCGTNGQTYRNPCELRRTACLQMRDIKLDYPGRCGMRKLPPTSQDRCSLSPEPGQCRAYFPRFFFNSTSKRCERFVYGGCRGNENNFETIAECQKTCGGACHCPFDGAEKGFLYEGESGMSTVVASSSVVKACRWDVVFFTEKNVDVSHLRTVAKDVDAKAREQCKQPVARFGWTRLDFDTPAYEVVQIGKGTTGDYGDFRLATKKPVVLSTGLGFVGAALDFYNLSSDCDSTRRLVLVADQFWKSESSLGGNVLEDMLAKAKAVLYSFVPQTDGNELKSVATMSRSFEEFDKKQSRRELCDAIVAPPPARGCHRCTCDGCTLQCCRVYDRDEDSCRAGTLPG